MKPLWYSGAPSFATKLCKSLIHPFKFNNYGGLAINPYQGCHHRCAYCYATYDWSPEFYNLIYAKSNAARVLDEPLSTWRSDEIGPVMVGSATDAYQPAEISFGLTRDCVRVLQRHNVSYYVFTKSTTILRDLELHADYSDNCAIIWSITTSDERVKRIVEPGTPPVASLFQTISKFAARDVVCGINIDPIIPYATDSKSQFELLAQAAKHANARHVFGSILRLRSDIWDRMKTALSILQVPNFEERYFELYGISPESVTSKYWSAKQDYQDRVLNILYTCISSKGLSTTFPSHLGSNSLKRAKLGQTLLAEF